MKNYRQLNYSTNQKYLLSILLNEKSLTRHQLVAKSDFSLLTVSKFIKTFLDDGIVIESGELTSTGGRKAGTLEINPNFAYALAVDIGASKVCIGVVSIIGTVIEKEEIQYYEGRIPVSTISPEELTHKLSALIGKYGNENVMGIGIGFSGIVNSADKQIIFCPNIDNYNNLSLSQIIEPAFNVPLMLNTSARCMALAEQRFGIGHNVSNQVFVSVGYSISTGIIINGSLFSGAYGFSGEIGHLPVSDQKSLCSCGNYDCLENYVTLPNIKARIIKALKETEYYSIAKTLEPSIDKIDFPIIQKALEMGDKQISSVNMQVSEELGQVLVGIVNTINPELIILGGGVIEVFPSIIDEVARVIKKKSLITNLQNLKISKSVLGLDCGLIGSATQIINHFFDA